MFNTVLPNGRTMSQRDVASSATVMVNGTTYLVDLGPHYVLRFHTVKKDKTCSCGQKNCNAVKAVTAYLSGGGQRASEQARSNEIPERCPICGTPVTRRGSDWACTRDTSHYHQFRVNRLRALRQQYVETLPTERRAEFDELHGFFADTAARETFLQQHALTYAAGG